MTRAAILCPGRGSYTERSLGSLPPDEPWLDEAEELRAGYDLPPLRSLDGATRFAPSRHLRPANVSPLIYLVSMLDARTAGERHDVVCVAGNSLGWYTALAAAGALTFADGFRLVQEMSLLQEGGAAGGQVLYPRVGDDWRPDVERERAVADALASSGGEAFPSIALGGLAVLAGSPKGVAHLMSALPEVEMGKFVYPMRLVKHGPYHTSLVQSVAEEARRRLAGLHFRRPRTTLVDGRGVRFTPWSTDAGALAEYTLGRQVTTPFDFTTSVRVALREYAPDRLVLPGPGNTLGSICGQILVAETWRGIRSRSDFAAAQESAAPIVESMRR